ALQRAYAWVDVDVKARPTYGPGRPSSQQPRVVTALRSRLQGTLPEQSESIARKRQETGCFVLLTNVPTPGEMAQTAGDVLQASKEQHGIENYQPCNLLKIRPQVSVAAQGASRSVACGARS